MTESSAARPADIARTIAFYLVFYLGSVPLVLASTATASFSLVLFRKIVRAWAAWHRGCARHLLGIRLDVEGYEPRSGVLYAIKHESFFEAIDMPRQFTLPVVFAKAELLRIPLWGSTGARYGLIGVEREAGAKALRAMISEARHRIADGRPLVIFPEGTRVPHGTQRPLQSGFAGIYKLLGLPVIPVAVDSGPLYHRLWKRSGTIRYRFGAEIPPGLPREEIEARVHAAINALNPTPDA
ncbi:lysophospholipid acyltransferase family protein [Novosphingobium percolationis]|uniref:lysophospholipid acyltransferase family protein n=1 Tax=Novosphingobium percolationis TaxID=2871811 RepID=UPI001CD41305|nr:lysophospholipid acyltransferase family protein [Novosphingobium percolationis]